MKMNEIKINGVKIQPRTTECSCRIVEHLTFLRLYADWLCNPLAGLAGGSTRWAQVRT